MSTVGTALVDPKKIFEKIHLAPNMRVADLGCGRTGQFAFSASKVVGEKGIVYAVDIMKDVLESIRSRALSEGYHNVQTVWSDIEMFGKTPIPEQSLSATFLTNVLFLVKDKLSVLREAARLVTPDGLVVVVDWNKQLGPLGPTPDLLLKPSVLSALAAQAGLHLVEQSDLNENHYCFIFKK